MPMVEYFDRASGSRKRKEFAYGAVGKENSRIFKKEQDLIAKQQGQAPAKITHPVKSNRMEGEKSTAKKTKPDKGMGTKLTTKQKLDQQQDFDQKEIDKNKPSEAKTEQKEAKYVKLDDKSGVGHKKAIGGGGPDHRNITY